MKKLKIVPALYNISDLPLSFQNFSVKSDSLLVKFFVFKTYSIQLLIVSKLFASTMDQIPIEIVGEVQQNQDDEIQIICEITFNQALLNEVPVQQVQEVVGPYDNWRDEVQILEEVNYPREMPYVILPGQPVRSYYDEEPKSQEFIFEQKELIWRPIPGRYLDPVQAMAKRLEFDQNIYDMQLEEFKEQQAEMAALAADDDADEDGPVGLDDLDDREDDDGAQGEQALVQVGVPRIVYR